MNPVKTPKTPIMTIDIPKYKYPVKDIRNFALQNIRMDVNPMDSIAILGESGSGKSTLLNILAGLLKTEQKNQVCMRSPNNVMVPLIDISRKKRYRQLQIVFQDNIGSLYEKETVQAALKHIARITGQKRQTIEDVAIDFFQQLHLISQSNDKKQHLDSFETFKEKQVAQLSMGMLRRYCLAKALMLMDIYKDNQADSPKILLVDEISRGLDQVTKKQLITFIQDAQKKYHLSIVAISHEMDFLKAFCNQFYFLFEGLLIPKAYTRQELSKDGCKSINNTYLRRYFIPCKEPLPRDQKMGQTENNCYFQQFYHCPDASDCINKTKETQICV